MELEVYPFVCDHHFGHPKPGRTRVCGKPGVVVLDTSRGPVVSCSEHVSSLKRRCQTNKEHAPLT